MPTHSVIQIVLADILISLISGRDGVAYPSRQMFVPIIIAINVLCRSFVSEFCVEGILSRTACWASRPKYFRRF